ncbi:MAG: hypothetical protein U0172_09685 [Nitrospiraceae bacterium]
MSDLESERPPRRVCGLEVVAVLPAAGQSKRLGLLPCSKELFPVAFTTDGTTGRPRPKAVAEFLLDKLVRAGVTRGVLVIRSGKWDIPTYFGDGRAFGLDLTYVVIGGSSGPPDSVDRAFPHIQNQVVAFGFPDILLEPADVFSPMLAQLDTGQRDVVLGLFPAGHDCRAMDMVAYDEAGTVQSITLKPDTTTLHYAWACAVWTPAFTEYLHRFMRSEAMQRRAGLGGATRIDAGGDIPVGAVFKVAVDDGMRVGCIPFADGHYTDVGTPADLMRASTTFRQPR